MQFKNPLVEAQFLKRYKRFFADVNLDGEMVVAHVPNTGSMKSCNLPESPCLISPATDPKRALKFTLEAIKVDSHWVGVNTSWPNKLAVELFKDKKLSHWLEYDSYQPEVKINDQSRIDLVLWNSQRIPVKKWKAEDFKKDISKKLDVKINVNEESLNKNNSPVHFVEIKNVTLKEGGAAQFPDAVTERGQKHIAELVSLIQKGYSAEILFIVQRIDVDVFEPAVHIDPDYARLLNEGIQKGLKVTAVAFEVTKNEIRFNKILKVRYFDPNSL